MDWYEDGKLTSDSPANIFDDADAMAAFRYMQKGTHIGKILLKISEQPTKISQSADLGAPFFPSDASYVLFGGLGGLGRAISNWMVERGARELVYLSRSAGQSKEDEDFLKELADQGCNAVCIVGSVTNLADVERAISSCQYPIRGILQMTAVTKVIIRVLLLPTKANVLHRIVRSPT